MPSGAETARAATRPSGVAIGVFLIGLAVTLALFVPAELSYRHNERRLLRLETDITSSLVATVPRQTESTIGRVAGLAAAAQDPVAAFNEAVAPLIAPKGQFASGSLVMIGPNGAQVLAHVGTETIRDPTSPDSVAVYNQAGNTTSLVTTRVVGRGTQKIGYLLSARGQAGTFVVGLAQQIPSNFRIPIAKGSPLANIRFAIYFGNTTDPSALVATSTTQPKGLTSKTTVPFGSNVLTFVTSARGPLGGRGAQLLPWGIAIVGVLLSFLGAFQVEGLVRRRRSAESSALVDRERYERQRVMSETLQRSLLPRELPAFAGVEVAARHVPGTLDAEVGGDWYTVVPVDDTHFIFLVGDVSGHGIDAAGMMASLRYTTRTLAKLGFPPDEILRRANEEIDIVRDGHFATALVGSVSMADEEVVIASAGHLPPYLIRHDSADFVSMDTGIPLGITTFTPRSSTVPFRRGSTLIAFTDGLVERRGEDIDVSLQRLTRVAARDASSADALLAQVVDTLTADGHEDDIAILVIRFEAASPATARPAETGAGTQTD